MMAGAQARMPPIDLRACLRLRFVANIGIKRLVNASDAGTFECSCSPVISANHTMTRRDFSRKAFAVGAATAASASRILGANDRIRMGIIGSGGRGREDWGNFLKEPDVDPVAVCDVYQPFLEQGIGLTQGRAKGYKDYRQVIDLKDVDAVLVATPDHWHALMTIEACQAGKDVYCEKPLSLVIGEGKPMIEAARKHGRVVQTGTMQRSGEEFKLAVELVQKGIVGKINAVNVTLPGPNWI